MTRSYTLFIMNVINMKTEKKENQKRLRNVVYIDATFINASVYMNQQKKTKTKKCKQFQSILHNRLEGMSV